MIREQLLVPGSWRALCCTLVPGPWSSTDCDLLSPQRGLNPSILCCQNTQERTKSCVRPVLTLLSVSPDVWLLMDMIKSYIFDPPGQTRPASSSVTPDSASFPTPALHWSNYTIVLLCCYNTTGFSHIRMRIHSSPVSVSIES